MAVYSSTYRDVIESLRKVILSHPAVKTFRVGPPSSIEMPDNEKPEIKYPYVHLVPQQAQISGGGTMFDFDLIVMDLAKDQLGLEERTQSSMLEITRDILAYYTRTSWEEWRFNIEMPLTTTPFVENFLNSVSGWTTQIKIEAIAPLNNCENPVMGEVAGKKQYFTVRLGNGSDSYPDWTQQTTEEVNLEWLLSGGVPVPEYTYLLDTFVLEGTEFGIGTKITNVNGRLKANLSGNFTVNILDYSIFVPMPPLEVGFSIATIVNGIVTAITPLTNDIPN